MDLFDFFFPDQSQAAHLRRLADSTSMSAMQERISRARAERSQASANKRIEELESEVGQLTIIVEALLESISDRGILSREDIAKKLCDIDERDGVIDGRITKPSPSPKAADPKPKFRFPE
jgi:hypothetical protein